MALVSPAPFLADARKNGYAVAAFNVHTLEMLQAVVDAAEECGSPIILQTTSRTVNHLGMDYIVAAARVAAEKTSVPIALHLDHCRDFDLIIQSMYAGYTSVMIDASMYPFEENVRRTKKVVEIARVLNINVEAELGKVKGVEDHIQVSQEEETLADPQECKRFVEQTGITCLAPAIGTAHGIYKGKPNIDFKRLKDISDLVSVPLVLHGGSGIPAEQVKRCVSLGISKMNVATEIKNAFSESIKESLTKNPSELDPRKYMVPAKEVVKRLAVEKIRMCGM